MFLKVLAGATGVAALAVAPLAIASDDEEPMHMPSDQPTYMPAGEDMPPMDMPSGQEMHQLPDGTWMSPLLPYAKHFPTKAALEHALAEARAQGLIR